MAVLMIFLLCGGGLRDGQPRAVSGGPLRPLQQLLVGVVPALCPVGGCPKVTADLPLALHKPLPETVVSLEGTFSPPAWLAARPGGSDAPNGALSGWCEQSKPCHLLLIH